ncbi:hypothetical protein FH5_04865 [Priestia endophytica]|nr:hypothetical protein FH5_04865 [Priestia endophytica]
MTTVISIRFFMKGTFETHRLIEESIVEQINLNDESKTYFY